MNYKRSKNCAVSFVIFILLNVYKYINSKALGKQMCVKVFPTTTYRCSSQPWFILFRICIYFPQNSFFCSRKQQKPPIWNGGVCVVACLREKLENMRDELGNDWNMDKMEQYSSRAIIGEKTKGRKFVKLTFRFSFLVPRRSVLWIFERSVYRACTVIIKQNRESYGCGPSYWLIVKLSGHEQKGCSSG